MATWETPKTDWTPNNGVQAADLNRMEENSQFLFDQSADNLSYVNTQLEKYIRGFRVSANNHETTGVYNVVVRGGDCASQSSVKGLFSFGGAGLEKIISADSWTAGTGASVPCKAPGATYSTNQWYHIFALYNPETETADFCVDDSLFGNNISGSAIETAGFTMWRRIGSVKASTLLTPDGLIPTTAINQRFYLAGDPNARNLNESLTAATTATIDLNDSNGVNLLPRDNAVQVPVEADFVIKPSLQVTQIDVWSELFGTTWYNGISQGWSLAGSEEVRERFPIFFHRVYAQSSDATNLNLLLQGYWDYCEII